MKKFNEKLHGLRGISVIAVLLFHFFPSFWKSGFIGVDIFFILSGYLVSKSVLHELQDKPRILEFIKSFYSKRFARIYPTLILVSSISFMFSLLFTQDAKLPRLVKDYSMAMLGVSNIGFYMSASDYFAKSSEYNFFTQTWSLGIEEQFYVGFSLIILLSLVLFKKNLKKGLIFTFSIIACSSFTLLFFTNDRNATFYLLPFRAWELSTGVILSLIRIRKLRLNECFVENLSAFFLLILFISSSRRLFPIPYLLALALPVVMIIYVSEYSEKKSILSFRIFQYFGTISYSLYLIHWPILVGINYLFDLSFVSGIIGFAFSVLLSIATYQSFEKPLLKFFRIKRKESLIIFSMVLCIFCMLLFAHDKFQRNIFSIYSISGVKEIKDWQEELECHGKLDMKKLENPFEFCLKPKNTTSTVFLTGDSHAVQLSFALKVAFPNSEVLYANFEDEKDVYSFTRSEIRPTFEVFDRIKSYAKEGDSLFLTFSSKRLKNINQEQLNLGTEVWRQNIQYFSDLGITIYLILDTPHFEPNSSFDRCVIDFILFKREACNLPFRMTKVQRQKQDEFYQRFMHIKNVKVIDLNPFFCDEEVCKFIVDDKIRFFDFHHLTEQTSKELGTYLKNIEELDKQD